MAASPPARGSGHAAHGREHRHIEFRQPANDGEDNHPAGQVLCRWIDAGGVLHEMEFAPEMLSDEHDTSQQ